MSAVRRLAAAVFALGVVAFGSTEPRAQDPTADVRTLLDALGIQVAVRVVSAPDFALENLTGTSVSLADHRGRFVLLYFWTSW